MSTEMVDPIGFIEKESLITPSQLHTLSTTPFARHDHVFPFNNQDDIEVDNDHDFWAQSSDDDDREDVPATEFGITFCSPPPSPPDTIVVSNDVVLKEKSVSASIRTPMETENKNRTQNDVVSGIEDELGFAAKKLKVCDTNDAINDVVLGIGDELGFIGERKRVREDFVSASSPLPMTAKKLKVCDAQNDVIFEEKSVSASLCTPMEAENTKRAQNDVVLGDSVDYTTAAKKLRFSDAAENGGDTQEVIIEDETEKVIETESDVDTEVITEEKEDEDEDEDEEEDEVSVDRTSRAKPSGDAMECLVKVLRVLSESKRKEGGEGGELDFLETAKRRGYTFPTPRWLLL